MLHKAVFLDKDGTLIKDIPFNVDPALIQLTEHSITGLRQLQSHGYKLIVVSNQSGVAHGHFSEQDLIGVQNKIEQLLSAEGIVLHDFCYCPHHPEGTVRKYTIDCECRKPKDGMLKRAALHSAIDLTRSWMIGDILDDVEAGNSAGCRSILIDNHHETEWKRSHMRTPFAIAASIDEAANTIIQHEYYELVERLS